MKTLKASSSIAEYEKIGKLISKSILNIHFLQESNKLGETIAERVIFHEARKLPFQPFIIIVGDLAKPASYYVVLSANDKYNFNCLMDCFDACFKIFFTLNLDYPPFGYRFWLFVQRQIYGIHIPELDRVSQINDIVAALAPYNIS
jgi:hypothetical protein